MGKAAGRRLAVLEKRATELAAARAAASEKRWNDYENEIELRTAEVEQWSEEVLASPELDIASRPVELVKAASAAPKPYPMPTPAPRPTSRRPRP